jgi:hypothetical protein
MRHRRRRHLLPAGASSSSSLQLLLEDWFASFRRTPSPKPWPVQEDSLPLISEDTRAFVQDVGRITKKERGAQKVWGATV